MNSIKFKPTTEEVIGETIGFIVVTGLQGWALVSFFSLTWGQALVISWSFQKLLDVIRHSGK